MKLRFLPRGDAMQTVPGAVQVPGQAKRYIGRKFSPKSGEYELTDQPYECEAGSPEATRCIKLMNRDGTLKPADAETAKAIGVAFETEKVSAPKPEKKGDK